jgi:predicted Zn-dependent protease
MWDPRIEEVYRLWEQDHDQALVLVESLIETWPGNAYLHILKAHLVQLQDRPTAALKEAKQSLERAVELDKGSPSAVLELAYFLDNVEDNPQAAASVYAECVATARHLLVDGLIGQAKVYEQLEKKEEC